MLVQVLLLCASVNASVCASASGGVNASAKFSLSASAVNASASAIAKC